MNICICGWYFRPALFEMVALSGYRAFVVKHRPGDALVLESALHDNIGLEFGAYDQYLQNHWDGESDVLFMHDDAAIRRSDAFDAIKELRNHRNEGRVLHQAFIFNNEWEDIVNNGKHGRAIWCSGEFLKQLKADGGFPYDCENTGTLAGPHVNRGINAFKSYIQGRPGCGYIAIVPGIEHGRRGVIPNGNYVYDGRTREGAHLITGAPHANVPVLTRI